MTEFAAISWGRVELRPPEGASEEVGVLVPSEEQPALIVVVSVATCWFEYSAY